MNERDTPVEVASSAQLGPVAEVRDGLLRLHIPNDDYSLPPRFLNGTHLLYEISSKAALDVLGERTRQIEAEGWTPEHDDEHTDAAMAYAAAGYAIEAADELYGVETPTVDPVYSPIFPEGWEFKRSAPRRMLVKAAALLLAEIERLDRNGA